MAEENFFNVSNLDLGIPRQLADGISTRVFVGEHAMLSIVRIEPEAAGKIHQHPEEQWGFLLEGRGVRTQDGREVPVKAGDFWSTPGGVAHGFKGGPEGATVLDVLAPPREDYKKAGKGFGVD